MPKPAGKPAKKGKTNGYQMPEPLPPGEILHDLSKKLWKLGPSIGKGGFGEIYSAQEATSKSSAYPYVIKIEPHANGPLFVERNFYLQNAKLDDVEKFRTSHKLKTFGMPVYLGSGAHESNGGKFRFLVMDKFGSDLDKLLKLNNNTFPTDTVFKIALQMSYVLEYIHDLGYVHADIKGANILMGVKSDAKNQAYLVDFGLAVKYTTEGAFKPNPKKAHDGTIEYLSRDAHQGVFTRRGDLEVLAYNMIHWLGGKLPWMDKLIHVKMVQTMKNDAMDDIPNFLKDSLKTNIPNSLLKYLQYVDGLVFDEKPNYKKIRDLFKTGITSNGGTLDGPLKFSNNKRKSVSRTESPRKISRGRGGKSRNGVKGSVDEINDDDEIELHNGETVNDAMKEVLGKRSEKKEPKKTAKREEISRSDDEASESGDGDVIPEVFSKKKGKATARTQKPKGKNEKNGEDSGSNLTYAMKEILKKRAEKNGKKTTTTTSTVTTGIPGATPISARTRSRKPK